MMVRRTTHPQAFRLPVEILDRLRNTSDALGIPQTGILELALNAWFPIGEKLIEVKRREELAHAEALQAELQNL